MRNCEFFPSFLGHEAIGNIQTTMSLLREQRPFAAKGISCCQHQLQMSIVEGVVNTRLLFYAQSAPVNILLCSDPSPIYLVFAPFTHGSLNQMEISNKRQHMCSESSLISMCAKRILYRCTGMVSAASSQTLARHLGLVWNKLLRAFFHIVSGHFPESFRHSEISEKMC